MKYLYLGLALLAMLILACCWSTQVVAARTEAVLLPLDCAAGTGIGGPERVRCLEAAQAAWRESLPLLGCLVSHSYTTEISEALAELSLQEGEKFQLSCLRLREKLLRLGQMDRLSLENIF